MICPRCGDKSAYEGLRRVECSSRGCGNFSEAQLQASRPNARVTVEPAYLEKLKEAPTTRTDDYVRSQVTPGQWKAACLQVQAICRGAMKHYDPSHVIQCLQECSGAPIIPDSEITKQIRQGWPDK